MKDEALKLALEALETGWSPTYTGLDAKEMGMKAITAIKQALAAPPVQEPVAWRYDLKQTGSFAGTSTEYSRIKLKIGENWTPLYTTPPAANRPWVGLTEQERNEIEDYCEMIVGKPAFEAIEAKLKEKNT
jgi:hypothetical protein